MGSFYRCMTSLTDSGFLHLTIIRQGWENIMTCHWIAGQLLLFAKPKAEANNWTARHWQIERYFAITEFNNWMAWCKRDVSDFFRWNFFSFKSAWIFACAFQLSSTTFPCIFFTWFALCFWEKQRQNIQACTVTTTKQNKSIPARKTMQENVFLLN